MSKRTLAFRIELHTGADALGRRQFTLTWEDPDGVDRPELGVDGKRVGFRRGQVFFASPDEHAAKLRGEGHTVEIVDGDARPVAPPTRSYCIDGHRVDAHFECDERCIRTRRFRRNRARFA